MSSLTLVLGLHNHQPVGNWPEVIAEANRLAYRPFLETLERHPAIKITLHITGPLLEWLLAHDRDQIERLAALARTGQVEFLTGGYYEPILPIIPDEDKVGQIRKLTQSIRNVFGVEARGAWLAERVWEPHLPKSLAEAGVAFTLIDESHFRSVGLREDETFGYFTTEELGAPLRVFPINERLRYAIPFGDPEESMDYLRSVAAGGDRRVVTMVDDGEKFGVWPGTNSLCYDRRWLERFFRAIEAEADWLRPATCGEVLDTTPPLGRVYLPAASYPEMMEWSLPPAAIRARAAFVERLKNESAYDANRAFVRGGFWRGFFRKYEEANHIHKKMLDVSRKIRSLAGAKAKGKTVETARDALWQAQCNCAYWHGLFGGLYLTNLRHALYECLIRADRLADSVIHGKVPWMTTRSLDFDSDGFEECVVESPLISVVLKPRVGGSIIEYDDRSRDFNLVDTLTRRDEAYHDKIRRASRAAATERDAGQAATAAPVRHRQKMEDFALAKAKGKGLDRLLRADWYRRAFVIDHFFRPGTSLEDFASGAFAEDGDFVNQPYEIASRRKKSGEVEIVLWRLGGVYQPDGKKEFEVRRVLTFKPSQAGFRCHHAVTNRTSCPVVTRFGCEFNVNLLGGDVLDRFVFAAGCRLADARPISHGETAGVREFGAADRQHDLRLTWRVDRAALLWRTPVLTVSFSEEGYEEVYQATCLMPVWNLELAPGETWDLRTDFEIGKA